MGTKEGNSPSTYSIREVDAAKYAQAFKQKEAHSLIGPNNVILQVNYACHLHCEMCDRYKWTGEGAPVHEVLSTNELADLFDQVASMGAQRVTLVGTEPVMRQDLPELLTDIRNKDMKPEFYTAGILLKDDVIQSILDNSVDVAFSVDGFKAASHNSIRMPDHAFDAHARTLESIKRLRDAREARRLTSEHVRITANFTIQKGNINDLREVDGDVIDTLGVDVLRMSPVHGTGSYVLNHSAIPIISDFVRRIQKAQLKTHISFSSGIAYLAQNEIFPEDFDQNVLIPSATLTGERKIRCHIGEYSTMIDPRGDVRPCLYLYDDNGPFVASDRDEFIIGNVKEQRFTDIWNGKRYADFREAYTYPNLNPGSRCRTCEYSDQFDELDVALDQLPPEANLKIGW